MNYLKELSIRLQISIHGYKTSQSIIDKIMQGEQRKYKPQVYTSNRKSLYINPPYNGKI